MNFRATMLVGSFKGLFIQTLKLEYNGSRATVIEDVVMRLLMHIHTDRIS